MIRLVINSILFFITLFFDRFMKYWAISGVLPEFPIRFISCNVIMNRGISWGWFHAHNTLQFIFITLIVTFIIVMLMLHTYARWQKNEIIWPYSLVLGGAISNMIDRILYGGVIDFIQVSCYGWFWPVFNVADMIIVFGISCIVIQELRQ